MLLEIIICFACFLVAYALWINKLRGLPPGPPPLPLIGNLLQLQGDIDQTLLDWRNKFGPVFTIWMPKPTVMLGTHKVIQEAIVRNGDKFGDRPMNDENFKMTFGGNYGLTFQDNAMWKEQRRFALHSMRDLGFATARTQDVIHTLSNEIVQRLTSRDQSKPVEMNPYIMYGVANVIWNFTFARTLPYGDPILGRVNNLLDIIDELFVHPLMSLIEISPRFKLLDPLCGGVIKQQMNANEEVLKILRKELDKCESSLDDDSVATCFADAYLLQHRKLLRETGDAGSFTRHQLLMACYDLWSAGFESTVSTLRYCFIYLINHPTIMQKVHNEIDENVGDREIRMEDQRLLPYCCAFLQEVQRIAVAAAFNLPRLASEKFEVGGVTIPAGASVVPQFMLVHLDPAQFKRPKYFCPERHIGKNGEFVKDPRITPFSVGKRACLGENLARMELFLIFTSLVQHLEFLSPTLIPPELIEEETFVRSPEPYKVIVKSRKI